MENCSNHTNHANEQLYEIESPKWSDTAFYLFVIVGIIGNTLIICIKSRLARRLDVGATPTHRLAICLATADLITAIFLLPFPRLRNVPNNAAGRFYCHIIGSRYLLWVSFRASVYTLTAIAIERFMAITYPYIYKLWVHRHYVKYTIGAIWICPLVIRLPQMSFRVVDDCGNCNIIYPSERSERVYGILLFLIEFFCPFFIIIYTSMRTMCVLRRHASTDDSGSTNQATRHESTQLQLLKRRLTIMFVSICASFMFLWTPDQLGIFLYHVGVLPRDYPSSVFYRISFQIAFLNAATANPIIYLICLPNFRRTLKALLLCQGTDRLRTPDTNMTSTDMTQSYRRSLREN